MGGFDQAWMALNPLCLVSRPIIILDHWTRPNHDAKMLLEQHFPAPTLPPLLAHTGGGMLGRGQMPWIKSAIGKLNWYLGEFPATQPSRLSLLRDKRLIKNNWPDKNAILDYGSAWVCWIALSLFLAGC